MKHENFSYYSLVEFDHFTFTVQTLTHLECVALSSQRSPVLVFFFSNFVAKPRQSTYKLT